MKFAGFWDRLNDRLNPIVVKELRQAVRSKFVVTVVLLFLLVQVSIIGIAQVVEARYQSDPFSAQGGNLFAIIQGILLATCMLVIPAYTGVRLAAERSDTNVDLLFITTLKSRAIISGKLLAALVLALLIFGACTPFMIFTYLLRGIDVVSIALVLALDLFAVALAIQIALFLAVIPANRIFKIILGLLGLAGLVFGYAGVTGGTVSFLKFGGGYITDSPSFWLNVGVIVVLGLTFFGLFFSWSVALISPPSANRALGMRLFLVAVWLATGAFFGLASMQMPETGNLFLLAGMYFMAAVFGLALLIAVNEREHWGPRVARTIPRRWWLRWPAFLLYSGAAGGVVFSVLMLGLTGFAFFVWEKGPPPTGKGWLTTMDYLLIFALIGLYTYAYALTALLVRKLTRYSAEYTWIIFLILVFAGSTVPYLISFLLFYREWNYGSHYAWLLSSPFTAIEEAIYPRTHAGVFLTFAITWAGVVTVLSVPWYARQVRGFRPHASLKPAPAKGEPPLIVTAAAAAATKTFGPH